MPARLFRRSALMLAITLTTSTFLLAENNVAAQPVAQEDQPLKPAIVERVPEIGSKNAPVNDIDSGKTPNAADPVSPQTEQALQNAERVVDQLPQNQTDPTAPPAAEAPQDWSQQGINAAEWTEDLGKGQFSVYAKAQVLLNRLHSSPGAIDGVSGKNMLKAISAFQVMNNLPVTGFLDTATWAALTTGQTEDAFQTYTLTAEDLAGPYADSIPKDYALQAKMKGLYYTRVTEMLGERFHMDEAFLKKINPQASFKKAGETILVANIREDLSDPVALVIAHKGAKQVYAFDSNNKMVASFPATIGSSDTPSPKGTYKIKAVAPNPWYGYNPKNFIQGKNMKPLSLPPGPNNPVGLMWIALSKPSFGIHGTPEPSLISKTASHGCIRLTNWDVITLSKRVSPGVTVRFLE